MSRLTKKNENVCELCPGNMCQGSCKLPGIYEKLVHYEDLEEQGKLVLFPSYAYFIKDKKVHEGWVQEVMYWHNRKPLYDIRYDDNSLANYRGYLGLTVFLTKEEAEARLKELNEEFLDNSLFF